MKIKVIFYTEHFCINCLLSILVILAKISAFYTYKSQQPTQKNKVLNVNMLTKTFYISFFNEINYYYKYVVENLQESRNAVKLKVT